MSRSKKSERALARPLQPMEVMVLSVLHDGPHHGYGLVQEIVERTEGALSVRPGNLYRVLDRLVDAELVGEDAELVGESEPPSPRGKGAERTRYFSITEAGRRRIEVELETLGRAIGASAVLRGAIDRGLESAS